MFQRNNPMQHCDHFWGVYRWCKEPDEARSNQMPV